MKLATSASESFKEQVGIRSAMMFFRSWFGVSTTVKIYKKWGSSAVDIAKKNPNRKLNVGIRCNFDVNDGVSSRFGIDVDSDDFEKALDAINSVGNIRHINIHCHFAKRNLEYWPLRASTMAKLCKLVEK
jgi:hypothetical protein